MCRIADEHHAPVARGGLARALERTEAKDPAFPVYSNVSAEPVRDAATACDLLVSQLTSPVCWTALVRRMVSDILQPIFLELGPGSVLANLVQRILPGTEVMGCGTVEEVERVLQRFE